MSDVTMETKSLSRAGKPPQEAPIREYPDNRRSLQRGRGLGQAVMVGVGEAWSAQAYHPDIGDFLALLKPRVMTLVVFTAFAGLVAAPGQIHPLIAVVAVLCITIAAGASGAINMWYDRDIDRLMSRTARRPIPDGRVHPEDALGFGVLLAAGSVMVMGLGVNWMAASLLALTIVYYVFIYTMWLKRLTSQNIVIGGAAGAFPPMIGWAAVTGEVTLMSLSLFAIIFVWTPPHFWALALFRGQDYAQAGVPMLPVVAGARETKRQIVIYSILLVPVSLLPFWLGAVTWVYAAGVALLGLWFVATSLRVLWESDDGDHRAAKRLFVGSILYLFLVFTLVILDRAGYEASVAAAVVRAAVW